MIVITDVGDSTDIHPRNKRILGERLAYWALANDYGKKIPFSGPLYHSMVVKNNRVVLSFSYTDGGLTTDNGEVKGFMIAGYDRVFYPAHAEISGDKIIVLKVR